MWCLCRNGKTVVRRFVFTDIDCDQFSLIHSDKIRILFCLADSNSIFLTLSHSPGFLLHRSTKNLHWSPWDSSGRTFSPPKTAQPSTSRTGARDRRPSSSLTAGRWTVMPGTRRCSSSASRATASSLTTAAATAVPVSRGREMKWTRTRTICRNCLKRWTWRTSSWLAIRPAVVSETTTN